MKKIYLAIRRSFGWDWEQEENIIASFDESICKKYIEQCKLEDLEDYGPDGPDDWRISYYTTSVKFVEK